MDQHYGGIAQVLGSVALVLGAYAGVVKARSSREKLRQLLQRLWDVVHADKRIPAPLRRDIEDELGPPPEQEGDG
jgi:hypothetical protein